MPLDAVRTCTPYPLHLTILCYRVFYREPVDYLSNNLGITPPYHVLTGKHLLLISPDPPATLWANVKPFTFTITHLTSSPRASQFSRSWTTLPSLSERFFSSFSQAEVCAPSVACRFSICRRRGRVADVTLWLSSWFLLSASWSLWNHKLNTN